MVDFEFDIDWPRTLWIFFGLILGVAVLFIVHSFIGTFVFGLFIYYATRRLYRRVQRRVGQRSLAASISLIGLALPALLLLSYTLAIGLQELDKFVKQLDGTGTDSQLAKLLDLAGPYLELSTVLEDPGSLITDFGGIGEILSNVGGVGIITQSLESLLSYLGVLGTGLLHLFVMFALAFYLLRDGSNFRSWADHLTDDRSVFVAYFAEVDESFDKVFYGNILNAIITGVIGAIVFSLLNLVAPSLVRVPYPALTGLLAGAASLIPIVGMKLVYVPLTGYLALVAATNGEGWWFVTLFAVTSFVLVDVIPDLMVRPYVSGGKLHTGALMFAYILGPLVFGWYGIFLGPIILVLVSHFVRIILPELVTNEPTERRIVRPEAMAPEPDPTPQGDGKPDVDDASQSSA